MIFNIFLLNKSVQLELLKSKSLKTSSYAAFVLLLFDYCNAVWYPTTAKLTAMIERIHSMFVKRLPPSTKLSSL